MRRKCQGGLFEARDEVFDRTSYVLSRGVELS